MDRMSAPSTTGTAFCQWICGMGENQKTRSSITAEVLLGSTSQFTSPNPEEYRDGMWFDARGQDFS